MSKADVCHPSGGLKHQTIHEEEAAETAAASADAAASSGGGANHNNTRPKLVKQMSEIVASPESRPGQQKK